MVAHPTSSSRRVGDGHCSWTRRCSTTSQNRHEARHPAGSLFAAERRRGRRSAGASITPRSAHWQPRASLAATRFCHAPEHAAVMRLSRRFRIFWCSLNTNRSWRSRAHCEGEGCSAGSSGERPNLPAIGTRDMRDPACAPRLVPPYLRHPRRPRRGPRHTHLSARPRLALRRRPCALPARTRPSSPPRTAPALPLAPVAFQLPLRGPPVRSSQSRRPTRSARRPPHYTIGSASKIWYVDRRAENRSDTSLREKARGCSGSARERVRILAPSRVRV